MLKTLGMEEEKTNLTHERFALLDILLLKT
jgi:hypothetical protein